MALSSSDSAVGGFRRDSSFSRPLSLTAGSIFSLPYWRRRGSDR
jgi:hypothetical protein